ncbi:MAG: hypothetical protein ACM3SP_06040 [Chloroflexota bacterium]
MKASLFALMGAVMMSLGIVGCASTTPIVSEWRNPAYGAGSFKRIMVGALGEDTSIRRNFEDEFVRQLRAAGVDALPSYRNLAEDEKIDEAKLKRTAQKAGADALIFARSIQVEQKSEYGPSYYPYTSFGIFGPHFGASWYGWGGVPSVYYYNEYVSEIALFDLVKNEVVWTGTIKTTEQDDVRAAIRSYVGTVMSALDAQNLVRKRQ